MEEYTEYCNLWLLVKEDRISVCKQVFRNFTLLQPFSTFLTWKHISFLTYNVALNKRRCHLYVNVVNERKNIIYSSQTFEHNSKLIFSDIYVFLCK